MEKNIRFGEWIKRAIALGGTILMVGAHAPAKSEGCGEILPNFDYIVLEDYENALTKIGNNSLPVSKMEIDGANMALFQHLVIGQQKAEFVGRIKEEEITADCFKDLTPYFSDATDKALIAEFDEKTVYLYNSTFGNGKYISPCKAVELGNGFKAYCQNTKAGFTAGGCYIFKNAAASTLHEWVCKYTEQCTNKDSSLKKYIWSKFDLDEFNRSYTFVLKKGVDINKVDCTTAEGALIQLIVEIEQMVAEVNREIYPVLLTDCSGFALYDFENEMIRVFRPGELKQINRGGKRA